MRPLLLLAAPILALASAPPASAAEMFGDDYRPRGDQPNTLAIVDCVAARTRTWDRRLNAAYKHLSDVVEPGQREPLKAAQRIWVQYRDANCGFYGAQEGTIRQIQAAECMRVMTKDRALELEQAARP